MSDNGQNNFYQCRPYNVIRLLDPGGHGASSDTDVDTVFNAWDLGITPAESDFASVDDTGFMGPRQADGSLPDIEFLKLKDGSKMIDNGTDVGRPYSGEAPDLGAFEF